jgi:hypothetical protein
LEVVDMRFHFPSFLVGYGAGVASALVAPRLKPVAVALAAAGYRFVDALAVAAARRREDLADLMAEARARAGKPGSTTRPS